MVDTVEMDSEYTDADLDGTWEDSTATHITLADNAITIDGEGASADGNILTISAGGTYVLSGTLSDGQIAVAAGTEDKLKIVLNAVSVNCETGPAILISEADKVFVTLAEGTQSYLSDGSSYALAEGEDEPNAVIFSSVDLTLNGTGELEIESSYRHAICSKDDLVITGGTYIINAAEDALRGRDCVKICAGTFEIEAAGDAIKSNNDEDSTLGFISVDGGTFYIVAGD
ncbi:MAG: carbohydrate-binding domain-containing protein, partial [Actinobacteria bacterium]|nr:carbohydrate-binding domain-containing protein [Actinomycetota bacterium]